MSLPQTPITKNKDLTVINFFAGPGAGKCLEKDASVLMYDGYSADFLQKELVDLIVEKMGPLPGSEHSARDSVYEKDWLNFIPLFEEYGWKVDCDRPGFNEMYDTNYTFRRKKK